MAKEKKIPQNTARTRQSRALAFTVKNKNVKQFEYNNESKKNEIVSFATIHVGCRDGGGVAVACNFDSDSFMRVKE